MTNKIVLMDEDNKELECFLNTRGRGLVSVGRPGKDISCTGCISLDKNDVDELISVLSSISRQMT